MRDYLLDTNIWSIWFEERDPRHDSVMRHVSQLFNGAIASKPRLWISTVTWGEIEYGYAVQKKRTESREKEFRRFISDKCPMEYGIDKHVACIYGDIRARLFDRYTAQRDRKRLRPEQLVDPATALSLGIQENDLWLVAQAVTRGLILVTDDRMPRLRETAGDLVLENWSGGPQGLCGG